MSIDDPNGIVGKSENERLEFKEAAVLSSPAKVARSVVGFLNAGGGDVWIGYAESNEIATARQPIPNIERERSALQNHLLDTIEPPLRIPEELEVTIANGQIRVSVKQGLRGPYAQRERGRHFWIRVGDRLRDMSREEIAGAFATATKKDDRIEKMIEKLRATQEQASQQRENVFWLCLAPTRSLGIDFLDDATKQLFQAWLTDAQTTGNRSSGWNFVNPYYRPKFSSVNGAKHEDEASPMSTQVTPEGRLTFAIELDSLYWKGNDKDPKDLWSFALMEYPVSIFRLMAKILGSRSPSPEDLQVVGGCFLSGIQGWRLRSGSPKEPVRPWKKPRAFAENVLAIDPADLVFGAQDMVDHPDGRALQLVRRIYAAFDFTDEDIPREFDQKEGILRLG